MLDFWSLSARFFSSALVIRLRMPVKYSSRSNWPAASGMLGETEQALSGAGTPAKCSPAKPAKAHVAVLPATPPTK